MLLTQFSLCQGLLCSIAPVESVLGIRFEPVIFNLRQQLLWQRIMVVFLTEPGEFSDTDVTLPVAAGWFLLLLAINATAAGHGSPWCATL